MICKHCGAEETIKTICNMKGEIEQYICTECGCTSEVLDKMKDESKPKELDLNDIELKKYGKLKIIHLSK